MSSRGKITRNFVDFRILSEKKFFDGNPNLTTRTWTVRLNRFEASFSRWPADRTTHVRDWKLFPGEDYLFVRTPWGHGEIVLDSNEFGSVTESGDIPYEEARA